MWPLLSIHRSQISHLKMAQTEHYMWSKGLFMFREYGLDIFLRYFSFLVFIGPSGRGFQIPYPSITLHAVSRAASGPSIYCQLDDTVDTETLPVPSEDAIEMRELTLIPQNSASCKFLLHI